MERHRGSRKMAFSVGSCLRRSGAPRDSSERELHEKSRLRDGSENRKERDRLNLKRMRAERSNEQYKEESIDTSDDEYKADEQGGRTAVHRTNQGGIRTLRSSVAVIGTPADEVIGAVVPRRNRSASVRSSPAVASASNVGGDFPASLAKKKMKFLVSTSGSNSRPSSTTQEDIEMEVAEALFDLQQSQPSKSGREKSAAADSDDMKRSRQAGSGKDESIAFSVQSEQSVKVKAEAKMAGSREEKGKEGRVDGGSTTDGELPSFPKAEDVTNPKPTFTIRKHVAPDVQNAQKQLGKDFRAGDIAQIAHSRLDKHVGNTATKVTVDNVSTDPEVALQNANEMSAATLHEAPVAIRLKMEKEGAVSSNQSISNVMGYQPQHDLSKSTQRQNLMEQRNHSSFSPLSSGIHGLSSVLPYTGYRPSLQALASSSTEFPPFKFSEPRKRCVTHQNIARDIRNHKLKMESHNRGQSDRGGVSVASLYGGSQMLDGNHLSLLNKPWVGISQGGQSLQKITGQSDKDKNVAAFISSKSSRVLNPRNNPRGMQPDSFLRGPSFIFPFGGHLSSSESKAAAASLTSLGSKNHPTFAASKEAPPPSPSYYMRGMTLKSSSNSSIIPIAAAAAASNMSMLPLRGVPFDFSPPTPSHHQKSFQNASSHRQQPLQQQSSKPTTNTRLMNFASSIPPPRIMTVTSDGSKAEFVSPEMQWHHHLQNQVPFHQMQQQAKQMARDKDSLSNKRQNLEKFPPAAVTKETMTIEAPSTTTKSPPLCRRDVASILGVGGNAPQQHPSEPKC